MKWEVQTVAGTVGARMVEIKADNYVITRSGALVFFNRENGEDARIMSFNVHTWATVERGGEE